MLCLSYRRAFRFFACTVIIACAVAAKGGEPARLLSDEVANRQAELVARMGEISPDTERVVPGDYLWLLANENAILQQGGPFAQLLLQLRQSKRPTPSYASPAVSALESSEVVGLVKCGVELPGFASRGDLIWISRVLPQGSPRSSYQECWLSCSTGKTRWMLPVDTRMALWPPTVGESGSYNTLHQSRITNADVHLLASAMSPDITLCGLASGGESENSANSDASAPTTPLFDEKRLAVQWAIARKRQVWGDRLYTLSEENALQLAKYPALIEDFGLEFGPDHPALAETMRSRLRDSKLPTVEKGERFAARIRDEAASGSGSQAVGNTVTGIPRVVGLVESMGDTSGFASRYDPIWVVHFITGGDLLGEVTQAGWINAMTGEARWIFPLDMPTTDPSPPEPGQ